jgi:hypothetical protein
VVADFEKLKNIHTEQTCRLLPRLSCSYFSELWAPHQIENFVCRNWPPGVAPGHLRALLTAAPLNRAPYVDLLIDLAANLVLTGHQRSLVQGLQEMGALPLEQALPPIQLFFLPGMVPSLLVTVCWKWRRKKKNFILSSVLDPIFF